MSESDVSAAAVLRRIAPSVLLPALVYEIGNGAIAPVIALAALEDGASTTVAGLMLTMLGIGRILGGAPAAWAAGRLGDRRAMLGAALVTGLAMAACLATRSIWVLAVALLVVGGCAATFYLARQTYIADAVDPRLRARALSTLAGAHRIGLFLGPFLGAAAIAGGGTRSAFAVGVASAAVTAVLLWVVREPDGVDTSRAAAGAQTGLRASFRDHRALFLSLGLAVLTVGAVRAARQTVLPLWADHIGLSAAATSLVFGIANAVDMSLFYPSGHVMDRLGRMWIAIPSMTLLGLGMMALPLSHGVVLLTVFAVVMSIGNGIGSGIMMTLGVDAAPEEGRTAFLAVWRSLSDTGQALGPLVPALVALVAPLAAGVAVTGLLGLLAAAGLARWVPVYSPYATAAMLRAQRES